MSKVVLVTGCSKGGIGYSLCEEYARQGCIVYATARKPESMKGFEDAGIRMLTLDVTNDENVQEVIHTIVSDEGRIDVLVNNAGMNYVGALLDASLEIVKDTYEVNTFSILRVTRAVFPYMAARKSGAIINIGSVSADMPTPWNGAYSSSKAAVRGISDVLWMELKPFNITCTYVNAGTVYSNIARNTVNMGIALPEDSQYRAYAKQLEQHAWSSQDQNALSSEDFARKVVSASLSRRPPRSITLGGYSTAFWALSWLPKGWVLSFLWSQCLKVTGS